MIYVCMMFTDVPKEPEHLEVKDCDKSSITVAWQPPQSDGGAPIKSYVVEMRSAKETKYKVSNSGD